MLVLSVIGIVGIVMFDIINYEVLSTKLGCSICDKFGRSIIDKALQKYL